MASDSSHSLKKELSLLDVYVIALGPMLSSGFFLLPGLAAAKTGPSVVLAYFLAGLLVIPAMLAKAELATAMPRAGGTYYFLDRSLGPLVGTVGGLGTWLVLILKSAFALIGIGAYLTLIAGYPMKLVAIGLAAVFVLVNLLGAKESGGLQRVLVIAVLAFLAVFTIRGMIHVTASDNLRELPTRISPFFAHGLGGLFATIGLVFISYAGLTKVASISEEVKDLSRPAHGLDGVCGRRVSRGLGRRP
jgi:APA family basic amino acid/polyamine antiporter